MPRCAHCGHEFAVSNGLECPVCAHDWRGPAKQEADRPAHLAVLDGPPDLKEAIAKGAAAESETARPRLVSSAGPAVPVLRSQNDSVPNGWMARLEAARMMASKTPGGQTEAQAAPPPGGGPPPLVKKKKKKKKKKDEIEKKPAHLLVAQLQKDEAARRKQESQQLEQLFTREDPDAISSMQIEVPKEVKKKRIPDWVVLSFLGVLVVGGIYGAYQVVQKEPAPEAKIDPKLKAAAERKKKAVESLEEGHRLAMEGKKSADAAIVAYEKALSLEPTLAKAERGLAIAYTHKEDKAAAVKHYKRYLELDPKAKDAAEVRKIIRSYEKKARRKKK